MEAALNNQGNVTLKLSKQEAQDVLLSSAYGILMDILNERIEFTAKEGNRIVDELHIFHQAEIKVVSAAGNHVRINTVSESGLDVTTAFGRELYLQWSDVKPGSLLDAAYEIQDRAKEFIKYK